MGWQPVEAGYARLGDLEVADPQAAAKEVNWLVMGPPINAAMLLGDAGIPAEAAQRAHAAASVWF